jgi:hypothetical protein
VKIGPEFFKNPAKKSAGNSHVSLNTPKIKLLETSNSQSSNFPPELISHQRGIFKVK